MTDPNASAIKPVNDPSYSYNQQPAPMKFEKLGQQPQQQQQLQEQDPVADQEAQRLYQEYLAAKSAYENYIKGNKPQLKDAGYKGKGMVTGSAYWSDERLKNIIGALRR